MTKQIDTSEISHTTETGMHYTACCTLAYCTHETNNEEQKIKNAKRGGLISREYYCGTCSHKTHKYQNWISEKHVDGCSWICLITLKDVSRFCECDINMHSGLTKNGYDKRQKYIKPYKNEK